ncbi:MAG TPA: polymer-forming cytoskeletal protein [Actinomycetota bacterium]|nr:polymer-forming cytoskeletal protein [Actinomycetota bacterium]
MGRWRHPRGAREEDPEQEASAVPAMPGAPPVVIPDDAGESEIEPGGADGTRQGREVAMDRPDGGSELSVVGPGTRIEGTVTAAGSLRVDGEVKGKITAAKDVTLSPQGRVEANIQATSITLAGRVKGDLVANGDVSLPADSRLDGDIQARNVVVGGVVMGDIVGKGKVELGPQARVEGDIRSQALAIAEGAVFIGTSVMGEEARADGGGKAS